MNLRIALINCPAWDVEFPPYSISLLSAVLRQNGFEARCFDFNRYFHSLTKDDRAIWDFSDLYKFWQSQEKVRQLFEKNMGIIDNFVSQLEHYNILGFSVQSLNYIFTIELAGVIKKKLPDIIIIIGGPECFRHFNPEYFMTCGYFDAICVGEGDQALPDFLFKIKNNQSWDTAGFLIRKNGNYCDCGDRDLVKNLDNLPFSDYSFLERETEKVSISSSRGCIHNCSFCCEKAHWDRYRYRSAKSIVEELVLLKKQFPSLNFVYFNDSLINGDMDEFERFCDLMIVADIGIHWGGHIHIHKEMTEGFLLKMKQAGAERLNFGIESGSDSVLKLMRKPFDRNLAMRVLEYTKEAQISFSVNLVMGHPGETEEEFRWTIDFFKQIRGLTDCIHVNPCLVLRGSDLYKNHKKWGIVLPENYVTDWFLSDGSNNKQIRMKRVNALQ